MKCFKCVVCWVRLSPREVAAGYTGMAGWLCEDCWAGWTGADEDQDSIAQCHGDRTESELYEQMCLLMGPPRLDPMGVGLSKPAQWRARNREQLNGGDNG